MLVLVFGVHALGAEPAEEASYILRPNDTISLSVYGEPDLSSKISILKTGQASFPLIGSVKIGGLTVAAAAEIIRALYAKDYLVEPKLNLTVDQYATDFISVIGAVNLPGQVPIPLSGHLDLASAIATVRGLAENADPNAIQLVRASGATSTYSLDAISGTAGRVKLGDGDRIIVKESPFVGKTVTVLGQVRKPGPLIFPFKGKLDLVNAVALAGGLTELANPKKLSLNRKGKVIIIDFKALSQAGDRPFLLEPDDVVTVAERLF